MGMCFLNDIFTNGQLIYTNTALVQNSRPSELWKCRCVSAGGLTVSRTTVSECFFIIIFHVSALSAILLHTQLLVNCVVLRFLTKWAIGVHHTILEKNQGCGRTAMVFLGYWILLPPPTFEPIALDMLLLR